jgi:two-component system chemotaxis response regulator CheB
VPASHPPPIVALGASAGGIDAICAVLALLPADLPAAVLVVVHVASPRSRLPAVLDRCGPLPCAHAVDGDPLVPGHVVVAVPDRHLRVQDGRVRLSTDARINSVRPSVDALFTSLVDRRERALAVVLSGSLDDGALGARAMRAAGGEVMVQSPEEAAFAGMPESTIRWAEPSVVAPTAELARRIVAWANGQDSLPPGDDDEPPQQAAPKRQPSAFTCPDCGGTLWELETGDGPLAWRCRV